MTTPLFARQDEMYYAVLGRLLNAEIFAYGGQGFGTLQESLVVDQYVPLVKPDLVILQAGSNDFVNNSWELESRSLWNNNLMTRPYLEAGRIRYHFPSRYWDYGPILGHSRLAYVVAAQATKVTATMAAIGWLYSVENDFPQGNAFPPLQRSIRTTEQIIARLKERLGPLPLVAFVGDGPEPNWSAIFEQQGVPFRQVSSAITEEERRLGASIRPDGSHWDARGHRVGGEALAQWLTPVVGQIRSGSPMVVSSSPDVRHQ